MNNNHSDLEITMEIVCTNSKYAKDLAYQELRLRRVPFFKIVFLKIVCKTALVSMSFLKLEYESYLYKGKDIKRAFWRFVPFCFLMIGIMVFLMFKIVFHLLIAAISIPAASVQRKLSGEFYTSDVAASFAEKSGTSTLRVS